MIQIAAWLRSQLSSDSSGEFVVVDIDAVAHSGRRSADLISNGLLPDSPRLDVVVGDVAPLPIDVYVAVGAPGVKTVGRLARQLATRQIDVVVVDEGIGTYGTVATRRAARLREGGREPMITVKALGAELARRLVRPERWPMYRKAPTGWTVNEVVAEEFRRHHETAETTDEVVFLSQPWVELGLVSADRYVEHLRRVATSSEALGARFVLRLHPVEGSERYEGFEIMAGSHPAELDPRVVNARAVLGDTSTALLNVASVFETPALRILGPVTAQLDAGLGPDQRSLLRAFLPSPVVPGAMQID